MEMNKRAYEKPETEVVEIKVQGQILAGSGDEEEPGGGTYTGGDE